MSRRIVFEDNFSNGLDPSWSWLREDSDNWRVIDDGLEIVVEPGLNDTVKNALIRVAPDRSKGKYQIEVTVHNLTHPTNQFEQAGITWYQNGDPMFKEVKELIDGELYIIPGKRAISTASVRLRLIVTENSWKAQYCELGQHSYETAACGELPVPCNDQVSIQCYNGPVGSNHWIRFENFCITQIG